MTIIDDAPLDAAKLEQFVFRAVDEVGATLNAALVVMGDRLGLYRALAGAGALTPAELAARTGTAERYVREWLNAQAAGGYVDYHPAEGAYSLPPEQTRRADRRGQPGLPAGVLPDRARLGAGLAADHRRRAQRRRRRLARAQPRRPRGLRALLPPRLQRQPRRVLAARARRRRRAARAGRPGRRRRLRPRRVDDPHGAGVPELDVRRLRLPRRRRSRPRASAPRRRASRDRVRFEVAPAAGYPRRGLRPRDDVRLPARHGRSGRRGAARARARSRPTARG